MLGFHVRDGYFNLSPFNCHSHLKMTTFSLKDFKAEFLQNGDNLLTR